MRIKARFEIHTYAPDGKVIKLDPGDVKDVKDEYAKAHVAEGAATLVGKAPIIAPALIGPTEAELVVAAAEAEAAKIEEARLKAEADAAKVEKAKAEKAEKAEKAAAAKAAKDASKGGKSDKTDLVG